MTLPIVQPGDDNCTTCGGPDVAWPKCQHCHSIDINYLHDRVNGRFPFDRQSWSISEDEREGRWAA